MPNHGRKANAPSADSIGKLGGDVGATEELCAVLVNQVELMQAHLAMLRPAVEPPVQCDAASMHSYVPGATPAAPDARLPMTDAQRELWALSQLAPLASCALNESFVLQISGPLDVARLTSATEKVITRHPAFRLRFLADGLDQRLSDSADFSIRIEPQADVRDVVHREACQPFDLEAGPTIRATLVKESPTRHDLIVYAHHLVMDGWSTDTLIRQICDEYASGVRDNGRTAYVADTSYISWLLDEGKRSDDEGLRDKWRYWMSEHEDRPAPATNLPWDRERPPEMTFEGDTLTRDLGRNVTERLRAWARQRGLTPYAVLLAATARVLAELSNQEEVVILLPAAGQATAGNDMVGYCVQALPVRLNRGTEQTLDQSARVAASKIREGFAHAGITISELATRCGWPRDRSRASPVDVMFNYSAYAPALPMADCSVIVKENPRRAVVYDLFLNFTEGSGGIELQLSYRKSLADPTTIDGWLTYLLSVVEASLDSSHAA